MGTEQSGLYTETQVRGFDLNDSGAYRIDDAYFSRAAALNAGAIRRITYLTAAEDLTTRASIVATPAAGPGPLAVQFDSDGTSDPDGDSALHIRQGDVRTLGSLLSELRRRLPDGHPGMRKARARWIGSDPRSSAPSAGDPR